MQARRSASPDSMPSVVVFIPPVADDLATSHSVLASPPKDYTYPSPHFELGASTSTSASLYPSLRSSSSAAAPQPLPSASYSLLASSASPRQPSGSSSSSSAASAASSSSSSSHTIHNGRFGHRVHAQLPVDPADPFDAVSDSYMSAKRSPPVGQALYTCRWRLRDKKLLEAKGHTYCNCKLMTPDLLAKHALSQHIDPDPLSVKSATQGKVACKWSNCFNRHYHGPAALAAHLIHDHLTHQMGLKYACIANECSVKTLLTSYTALVQHHARYHAGTLHAAKLRPLWQPVRAPTNEKRISRLFATLASFDAQGGFSTTPSITVSKRANPAIIPSSDRERAMDEIEYKRNYFDPIDVRPGEGQHGQPWIRLHKRLEQSTRNLESVQSAHDAILRAIDYDVRDLRGVQLDGLASIDMTGDPMLRAIEQGLREAQLYDAVVSSSPHPDPRQRDISGNMSLPSEESCQVCIAEIPATDLVETMCPASLDSIEREMNFDASLSKQRRWVDKIFKRNGVTRSSYPSSTSYEHDPYDPTRDWAPPLRLDPYHPASRCRFPVPDEQHRPTSPEKPRAIRRQLEASQDDALPSGQPSSRKGRGSTPSERSQCSNARLSLHSSVEPASAPVRVKREREEDHSQLLARGLDFVDDEPPTAKLKGEDYTSKTLDLHAPESY